MRSRVTEGRLSDAIELRIVVRGSDRHTAYRLAPPDMRRGVVYQTCSLVAMRNLGKEPHGFCRNSVSGKDRPQVVTLAVRLIELHVLERTEC